MLFLVRKGFKVLLYLLLALVGYLLFTFGQVYLASRSDDAVKADAIVVFGAAQYDGEPSPVLKARLDHAAALYDRDLADLIVVTGGKQPGDRVTEATASADYLHTKGVPDQHIKREVQGRDSWHSLAAASVFLREEGRTEVLLVSDPFHAKRIRTMAQELKLTPHVSPTRTSPISGSTELTHFGRETVAVAIGRVIGFRRLVGIDAKVGEVRNRVESTRTGS